jgi:hypothetical protein
MPRPFASFVSRIIRSATRGTAFSDGNRRAPLPAYTWLFHRNSCTIPSTTISVASVHGRARLRPIRTPSLAC